MYELSKLAEAQYFYNRMLTEFENRENFTHNLSAFLSAARSVLQYALDEAATKTGGQAWYDKFINNSPILSFFRDKRDINIHIKPIEIVQHASVDIKATVHISSSLHVKHYDADGNLLSESHSETPKRTNDEPKRKQATKATIEYRFGDWSGSDDVISLSQMYINALQLIINDGVKKGFITG